MNLVFNDPYITHLLKQFCINIYQNIIVKWRAQKSATNTRLANLVRFSSIKKIKKRFQDKIF